MRAYLPAYELLVPRDFKDALNLIQHGAEPFAGGTDLMVQFETGKLAQKRFVSLWNLPDLVGIEITSDTITLGALTTYSEIRENNFIVKNFPNLVAAARETGAVAIQNRGTLGGNIANNSPAADSPPALLCYDASIELVSTNGSRWISYDSFHTGYKTSLRKKDEIIRKIRLPIPSAFLVHFYRKVGTRKAQAITKVGMSATFKMNKKVIDDLRLAFSSVAPYPIRCTKTEDVLRGQLVTDQVIRQAKDMLATEIAPIDDIRSSQVYRVNVAQNILASSLTQTF